MNKTLFSKSVVTFLICLLSWAAGLCFGDPSQAGAAVKCYTIGTSNVQVYSNTGLSKRYGAVYPSDEMTVSQVTDRYCKVTYPVARGRKTGYISRNKILTKTTGSSYRSRAKITTYRRAGNKSTYGYIAKGDTVKVLGASGSYTQVKYPVSGGYKYAFIRTSDLKTYILPSAPASGVIKNGTYKIVSALNNNFVMDVNGASAFDGVNIQLYQDNGSNAQKFAITRQADGSYTIQNVNSKKVMDCAGAGRMNGTNIQQYTSNATAAQRWNIADAGNGMVTLTCRCNGLLAAVSGGRSANGTNIHMYTANGSAAQKWKLVAVSVSNTPAASTATRERIVAYELSQLGIGDYRGNNNVTYNTWYYGRPVSSSGYAWCMAFQSYCANQMGVLDRAIPKTASCAAAVSWYKNRSQFQYAAYYGGSYTPKAGDLVFYYEKGSFCHVGMVTAPPVNGYLQTVEGNVPCADGNYKVVQFTRNQKRMIRNSYVYGYGTPSY